MAEGKRRSQVKVFVHRTDYTHAPWNRNHSLFGLTNLGAGAPLDCMPACGEHPPSGAHVLLRVGGGDGIEVLWGNQLIGRLRGDKVVALRESIVESGRTGGIAATWVESQDAGCSVQITGGD